MMMTKPSAFVAGRRPFARGICLVVRGRRGDRGRPVGQFPARPHARDLSESIPLFFIGRNENGLWVAREAEGRKGGIFLFRRSALRFAAKNSGPAGCATMFVRECLELDVDNQGNLLAGWLDAAMRTAAMHLSLRPSSDANAVAADDNPIEGDHR
jgi:hypothetical protein